MIIKIIIIVLISIPAIAATDVNRQKLFLMEKNYHQGNLMVISAMTNKECQFVAKEGTEEFVDYYWLMDGSKEKKIHPLIRSGIKKRTKFNGLVENKKEFHIELKDLSELKHDLNDINIDVKSELVDGKCLVKSILKLGPSENNRSIALTRTFCDVNKNFVGIPTGCKSLELTGTDVKTNQEVKVKFAKK